MADVRRRTQEPKRALVLTTKGQVALGEKTAAQLEDLAVGAYPGAVMHTPAESGEAGCAEARRLNADCTVAVGGGSAIGLGKVIARDVGLPQIAVPTTYSGSEMTAIWGVTKDGVKTTGPDPKVLPVGDIYDPGKFKTHGNDRNAQQKAAQRPGKADIE